MRFPSSDLDRTPRGFYIVTPRYRVGFCQGLSRTSGTFSRSVAMRLAPILSVPLRGLGTDILPLVLCPVGGLVHIRARRVRSTRVAIVRGWDSVFTSSSGAGQLLLSSSSSARRFYRLLLLATPRRLATTRPRGAVCPTLRTASLTPVPATRDVPSLPRWETRRASLHFCHFMCCTFSTVTYRARTR